MRLPDPIEVAAFDALHDDAPAWRDIIADIAAEHGGGALEQAMDGTVLVALCGDDLVVKLYPPFLADHFAFERAALALFEEKLSVATPALVASGARDGWPYLVMTQLHGTALSRVWPERSERWRCDLLEAIGALEAEVHALPPGDLVALAPPWDVFLHRQRARCHDRQERTKLPAHLVDELDRFLDGDIPRGAVPLTGEYTPMNLLVDEHGLVGMYDFGDGLVGAREYDWLGPLCFLAAGSMLRRKAFFRGYGAGFDDEVRAQLLRLLLLHRYSNLPFQLALHDWRSAPDLDALAARLWPNEPSV
jgi:hygromycin-B 7''-O-kinase